MLFWKVFTCVKVDKGVTRMEKSYYEKVMDELTLLHKVGVSL